MSLRAVSINGWIALRFLSTVACSMIVSGAMNVIPGTIENTDQIREGVDYLRAADPRFEAVVAVTGQPPLRRRAGGLEGLLNTVVGQQVSKASAEAIWQRMTGLFAPFDPNVLAHADDEALREAGLSRPKMRTVRAVSRAILDGELVFDDLAVLDDEGVHAVLTAIKGIGPWTADIYLLACLGRCDAWPAGDLALQIAAHEGLGLEARPDAKAMAEISGAWQPWRGVAARLLWAYYSATRSRDVAP